MTGAYGGAYGTSDINSKPGAVAQIVYQSEVSASTFSGATAAQYTSNILPIAEAVATQWSLAEDPGHRVDAELRNLHRGGGGADGAWRITLRLACDSKCAYSGNRRLV